MKHTLRVHLGARGGLLRHRPIASACGGPAVPAADRHGLHAAIADTEPDGWAKQVILRDHAKRRSTAREAGQELPPLAGSLDFLLTVDDHARIGALRFADESGVSQRPRPPKRAWS